MKELSIEEKAKRYDEAIALAKNIHRFSSDPAEIKRMEQIFPELKESEDGRIRKEIINFLYHPNIIVKNERRNDYIDWIEKQGEQKPVNKPKFDIGDLITNGILVGEIDEIHKLGYHAYFGDHYADVPDAENWHKWTIKDAKDGDVLSFDDENIVIFKDLYNATTFHSYCYIENNIFNTNKDKLPSWWEAKGFKPATKKQRDILFAKMHEAEYKWDDEKKELKKIIDEEQIKKNLQDNNFRRMFEQKPVCSEEQRKKESLSNIENRIINFAMQFHDNRMKPEAEWEDEVKMLRDNISSFSKIDTWSEEDEKIFLHVINDLKFLKDTISIDPNYAVNITDIEREINWFESLKDRVQTKQEWSERDELMLEESIGFIKSSPYPYAGDTIRGEISKTEAENWLKSLKDRVLPQPKKEWSEEDEQYLLVCKNALAKYQTTDKWDANIIYHWLEDKLKSLRLQSTWRPSEEQMNAFDAVLVYNPPCSNECRNHLITLYNELKKLREKQL